MFFTYILELSNGKFYIGQTNNLEDRLNRHNKGQCNYTRKFLPAELLYCERYETRSDAMKRERYFKSLKSRSSIERIIKLGGDTASSSNG